MATNLYLAMYGDARYPVSQECRVESLEDAITYLGEGSHGYLWQGRPGCDGAVRLSGRIEGSNANQGI
jgi:hypothetical protein